MCTNGTWVGGPFTGCTVLSSVQCPNAYAQPGYGASANCGTGTAGGTVCTQPAGCEAGYTPNGEAGQGTVTCEGGVYVGAFRGCHKAGECDMPEWLCDRGLGRVKAAYKATSYLVGATVDPHNCRVPSGVFVDVKCADKYKLQSGNLEFRYCLNGTLMGGASSPVCGLVEQAPCVCGANGGFAASSAVNKGRYRLPPGWTGPGYNCWTVMNDGKTDIQCFCRCAA